MCGRYTLAASNPAEVRARFGLPDTVPVRQRFNVAPSDGVLAITTDREGHPRAEELRWGLVPSWAKSPATGLKMINARVESVRDRPAYRRAFERFRCLIVADGFYEWQRLEGPGGGKGRKQPYWIHRADAAPFAFDDDFHRADGIRAMRGHHPTRCPVIALRHTHDRPTVRRGGDANIPDIQGPNGVPEV